MDQTFYISFWKPILVLVFHYLLWLILTLLHHRSVTCPRRITLGQHLTYAATMSNSGHSLFFHMYDFHLPCLLIFHDPQISVRDIYMYFTHTCAHAHMQAYAFLHENERLSIHQKIVFGQCVNSTKPGKMSTVREVNLKLFSYRNITSMQSRTLSRLLFISLVPSTQSGTS